MFRRKKHANYWETFFKSIFVIWLSLHLGTYLAPFDLSRKLELLEWLIDFFSGLVINSGHITSGGVSWVGNFLSTAHPRINHPALPPHPPTATALYNEVIITCGHLFGNGWWCEMRSLWLWWLRRRRRRHHHHDDADEEAPNEVNGWCEIRFSVASDDRDRKIIAWFIPASSSYCSSVRHYWINKDRLVMKAASGNCPDWSCLAFGSCD